MDVLLFCHSPCLIQMQGEPQSCSCPSPARDCSCVRVPSSVRDSGSGVQIPPSSACCLPVPYLPISPVEREQALEGGTCTPLSLSLADTGMGEDSEPLPSHAAGSDHAPRSPAQQETAVACRLLFPLPVLDLQEREWEAGSKEKTART